MVLYPLLKFWESSYKNDRQVRINFILSLVLNILIWLAVGIKLQPFSYLSASGNIPLHFNVYFGIDVYAPWYYVFIIPAFGLMVIILNNIIGYLLFAKERLLSYFLAYVQTLVNLVLLAAGIFVILLNI